MYTVDVVHSLSFERYGHDVKSKGYVHKLSQYARNQICHNRPGLLVAASDRDIIEHYQSLSWSFKREYAIQCQFDARFMDVRGCQNNSHMDVHMV